MKRHILSVFVLFAMVILALGSADSGDSGSSSSSSSSSGSGTSAADDSKIDAWVMAQQFVEKRLKSPGTAEWGSIWDGTYQDPDECITDLGGGKYRVRGWVDAQNSFGAKVRMDFVLTLQAEEGGDTWRLLDINMTQR